MKNSLLTLIKATQVIGFALMTLFLVSCSNNNGSSNNSSQYVYSNGVCFDTRNNMQVQSNLCANSTRYQYLNGQCYDSVARNYTTANLCQSSYNQYGTSSCNGVYYYNLGYGVQTISCNSMSNNYYSSSYQTGGSMTYNCRGLTLYQPSNSGFQQSYQQVTCQ